MHGSISKPLVFLILSTLTFCQGRAEEEEFKQIDKYCQANRNHTLCLHYGKIGVNCGSVTTRGLSEVERSLAADLHNQLRARVARGEEIRGHPGPQPPASNMMQMVWDDELELEAQTWADQCVRDHDCPDCRSVDRFSVGENLYWYGHSSGSWERSVQGWYDEVVDFNATFVSPFHIIKGVLVGHYTQLAWAQAWKIGCGKIFYQPTTQSSREEQLFICNYGLAGNLIGSEMYQIGEPCSQCPAGTSCSETYPGLCLGIPEEPLTIRPSIPSDFFGYPSKEEAFGPDHLENSNVQATLETIVIPPPLLEEEKNSSCIYECRNNGGCSVKIQTAKLISGPVLGSCFPPDFGGDCSEIPESCSPCLVICSDFPGQQLIMHVDENGNEREILDVRPLTQDASGGIKDEEETDDATCYYKCQSNGGCSVKIQSSKPISGHTQGSCFSPDFGGFCSGIPDRCESCDVKCIGRSGEEFNERV